MRGGHRLRQDRAAAGDERGETLVEILVTVVIMGVGIIGVLLGFTNAVLVSDRVAIGSRANLATHEEAELLKDPRSATDPVARAPYIDCARPSDYPVISSLPSGWAVDIVEIVYWDDDDHAVELGWVDRATCQSQSGGDAGTQRITVEVTSPAPRRVHERVVMVKRDQACPSLSAVDSLPC